MRPNARQFRRHAREAGQSRAARVRQKPAEQIRQAAPDAVANTTRSIPRAFDYRLDGLHNAPDADQYGLRWVSLEVFSHRSTMPKAYAIEAARRLEAEYMGSGRIPLDIFNAYARPEFLRPNGAIVALTLSPIPKSWNNPKADAFRPDMLARFVIHIVAKAFDKIAAALKPTFG